ncbi:MAG: CoA transferase [Desulfobacterium sp.]|nr:CoA transferase [Desulfobacterium sp.]
MLNTGALSGIKVLDLSRLLPGPFCSMILADHGAEVVSVEDEKFKAEGVFLNGINRNKRHMALDLKSDQGRGVFLKLAKDADVILEGFRPGVVKRLGVDYETIQKLNPGIIYCSITGYGQTGPLRDRPGHDANYLATSGILDLIGQADAPPSIPGVQFADIAGGAMNAAMGILMALFERTKSGQGQYIDISMTDGMLGFLHLPLFFSGLTGKMPKRSNTLLSHRYACYNTYGTADNRYITIGAVEHGFWKRLCECLDLPDYVPLQYDEARREEIINTLTGIFKERTVDEWDREFRDVDVCYAKIQDLPEVMADPLFKEREMVVDLTREDGTTVKVIGIPVKLSRTPGTLSPPPEQLEETTDYNWGQA